MSLGLANDLGIEPQAGAANVRITGAGGITAAVTLPGLMIHVRNYTLQVNFLMLPLGATKNYFRPGRPIRTRSHYYLQPRRGGFQPEGQPGAAR